MALFWRQLEKISEFFQLDQNEGIIFIINPFPVTPADILDAANLVLTLRIRNKTEKDDPSTSKPVTSVEVNLINSISKKAQSKKNHHTLIVGSHIKARLLSFLFRGPCLFPDSFKNAFSFPNLDCPTHGLSLT